MNQQTNYLHKKEAAGVGSDNSGRINSEFWQQLVIKNIDNKILINKEYFFHVITPPNPEILRNLKNIITLFFRSEKH